MSVRYAVLGLLSDREMHGYELKTKFDHVTGGFWQLNFGQIYSTLDRLEREGLVERTVEHDEDDSERKIFHITVKGREKLDDWLVEPVARPRALRDDLFVRLLFSDRSDPDAILRLISRHRDVYELEARKLTKRKGELGRLDLGAEAAVTDLLMDAALFHVEAELRWLGHVERKLLARFVPKSPKREKP